MVTRAVVVTRAVISQQTHLQSKISYLMAEVVFWFPSTLPLHFLISDMATRPRRLLSSTGMRSPRISHAGTYQYGPRRQAPSGAPWSWVLPHYLRGVLGLGTTSCSSHSPHNTMRFGRRLWTLTCGTHKGLATSPNTLTILQAPQAAGVRARRSG